MRPAICTGQLLSPDEPRRGVPGEQQYGWNEKERGVEGRERGEQQLEIQAIGQTSGGKHMHHVDWLLRAVGP